jgi:hypothetical protein
MLEKMSSFPSYLEQKPRALLRSQADINHVRISVDVVGGDLQNVRNLRLGLTDQKNKRGGVKQEYHRHKSFCAIR